MPAVAFVVLVAAAADGPVEADPSELENRGIGRDGGQPDVGEAVFDAAAAAAAAGGAVVGGIVVECVDAVDAGAARYVVLAAVPAAVPAAVYLPTRRWVPAPAVLHQ